MPKSHILNVENISFNAIHENKFLAKISEFTEKDSSLICFANMFQEYHCLVSWPRINIQNKNIRYTVKNMCNFTPIWWQLNCHSSYCNHSTALTAMFCPIVLIRRITTTIIGRNCLTFITEEMHASSCLSRKVSACAMCGSIGGQGIRTPPP